MHFSENSKALDIYSFWRSVKIMGLSGVYFINSLNSEIRFSSSVEMPSPFKADIWHIGSNVSPISDDRFSLHGRSALFITGKMDTLWELSVLCRSSFSINSINSLSSLSTDLELSNTMIILSAALNCFLLSRTPSLSTS